LPHPARSVAAALLLTTSLALGTFPGLPPEPAAAVGPKVAVIVGPVGTLTDRYRTWADEVATAAEAAGATVAKAYSPRATWRNVLAAVEGANVIVYFGHGNGYPNPYGSTELTDRSNGWGLNTATTNGDADSWSAGTLVYCGEKAILGTLTMSDGAAQRRHCSGGPIAPAPGFTMIYAQAHYAPGFGERYDESDPLTTRYQAQQRVRNYSYPMLALGAGAVFATAYGDADEIVGRVLTQSTTTYIDIFRQGRGHVAGAVRTMAHPDVPGAAVYVQRTTIGDFHFGDPDFWYAMAGDPYRTPGAIGSFGPPPYTDVAGHKFYDDIVWLYQNGIMRGCSATRFCPTDVLNRAQLAGALAAGLGLPSTTRDYFTDDEGSPHEDAINRLRAAGLTSGCGSGRYCPGWSVTRATLARDLARALNLPPTATDYFPDDDGHRHEDAINRITAAGMARGCGNGRYCPDYRVNRGLSAFFLRRAFD